MSRYRSGLFLLWILAPFLASAAPDLKFDVVTFCCNCAPDDSMCQSQFDHLNFPATNGHFIAMGSDAHRLELATNGNALAIYYDTLNVGSSTNSADQQASNINYYAVSGFTSLGPRPDWIVLNEISSGNWPSDATYRAWVRGVIHALKATYGYNVIIYSPFPNPGANGADWQALANDAYIGIENYLSGAEIQSHAFSVSYCQSQYQSSISSYTALGVPRAKLMLGEHFAQTTSGTGWGRSGVSSNDWDTAISVRSQAAQNVAFTGYLTYAWSKNAMLVSEDELIHFEDTYRTNLLPVNSGVTSPFIVLQPQSQIAPVGSDVSFLVFRAGTAPTTFQWRVNGANIPGATGSVLNLTNIQVTDAANYSVVLSNSAGTVISSNAFLDVRVPDAVAFDPFTPATTTYSPGAPLIAQTNAVGQGWTQAGPTNANQPVVQSGSLIFGGLAASSGNSVRFGGNGISARFNLGTNSASGTWYYSFVTRIADITGLSSGGVFWAAFNNSAGFQNTTPTIVGTRVLTRSATGGFNIGLDKSSGSAASFVFATNTFTTNDTIFIVGSYTFNSATTSDDLSQLWVNPPASTFGLAAAPPATLTNSSGNDISQIASFVLFNRNAAEPAVIIADDVRVGTSWASVTPPAESSSVPALSISVLGSTNVLSWSTNSPGYVLESSAAIAPASWSPVVVPVYTINDSFVVTNVTANTTTFYRLRRPQ